MKYKLKDIAEIVAGGTPSTKIDQYWNGEIAWITPKDLANHSGRYISIGERNITKQGLENSSAKLMPINSVLFTSRAPIGYVAIAKNQICTNQGFKSLVCKNSICYYMYIYYWLIYNTDYIKSKANGSTFQEISTNVMKEIEIDLPSIDYQKKVANILGKIDEKIELNNQINDNLYEVGVEVLKNNFTLEKGRVTLSRVIKFVKGKKPNDIIANEQFGYEKYLTIACLNGQELNYADTNKMIMSNNDLLMVMDGASSGEVYYGGQGIVGSTLSRIDCIDNNYISEFIFFCLKYYKDLIKSKNTGSAIPHTDKVFVGSLEIPKLNIEKQEKYKVLLSKIQHNQNENKILEQLRDTLLPKLMNGEIDLDKIEC